MCHRFWSLRMLSMPQTPPLSVQQACVISPCTFVYILPSFWFCSWFGFYPNVCTCSVCSSTLCIWNLLLLYLIVKPCEMFSNFFREVQPMITLSACTVPWPLVPDHDSWTQYNKEHVNFTHLLSAFRYHTVCRGVGLASKSSICIGLVSLLCIGLAKYALKGF